MTIEKQFKPFNRFTTQSRHPDLLASALTVQLDSEGALWIGYSDSIGIHVSPEQWEQLTATIVVDTARICSPGEVYLNSLPNELRGNMPNWQDLSPELRTKLNGIATALGIKEVMVPVEPWKNVYEALRRVERELGSSHSVYGVDGAKRLAALLGIV